MQFATTWHTRRDYPRVSLRLTKFHRLRLEILKSPVYSRVSLRLTKFHRLRLEILKSSVSHGAFSSAAATNKKAIARWLFCLAHPARFERATFRLGGGRSILLSYGCTKHILLYGKEGDLSINLAAVQILLLVFLHCEAGERGKMLHEGIRYGGKKLCVSLRKERGYVCVA